MGFTNNRAWASVITKNLQKLKSEMLLYSEANIVMVQLDLLIYRTTWSANYFMSLLGKETNTSNKGLIPFVHIRLTWEFTN